MSDHALRIVSSSDVIDDTVDVSARRSAVRAGAVSMLPFVVAYVPFALVVGAAASEHGSPVAGWSGSWLIYGGSAHLAALRTLQEAGPATAVLVGLLINARLVVYSAGLARTWQGQPRWFRLVAAPLIIDPTFASATQYAPKHPEPGLQRRHFIAAGLTLGAGWSAAIAAGVLLGPRLGHLDIEIVVPLCLLALLGEAMHDHPTRMAIVTAVVAALSCRGLPAGTGVLVAIAAGAAAGLKADRRLRP
jgi:predicted branched-subunit amino acid permease